MDCQDVDPSRLERARREILDLIDVLEGDRIGLVIFAGGAYSRMPLSRDYRALEMLVREMDTSMFQAQGSAVDEAILAATTLLTNRESEAGRAIVVLSDGEIHDVEGALSAAREAANAGVVIYGVGIGEEASPIPSPKGGYVKDQDETVVRSAPSEVVLTDLARLTGGAFVRSLASADDITNLYHREIRGRLRAAQTSSGQRETWRSGFQWPLGLGLVLLMGSAWLGDGRRRGLGALAALGVVYLLAPAPATAQTLAEGDDAYRDGRYIEAEQIFTELGMESPGNPELMERLGAARYRNGDYEGAARAWEAQQEADPTDVDASFNAANARYLSGHLQDALEGYDDVLTRAPGHPGATTNRQLLEQELQWRLAQQPPPPPSEESSEESEQSEEEQQQDGEESQEPQEQQEGSPGEMQPQQEGGDPTQSPSQTGETEEGESQSPPSETPPSEDPSEGDPADQQRSGEQDDSEIADLEDLSGGEQSEDEGGEQSEASAAAGGEGEGQEEASAMTAAQAERLLDGVEEGRPRIVIPYGSEEKPW
jgi:Ca-activated chloride channel family protein